VQTRKEKREGKLHLFLTSTVNGDEESASHTGRQGRLSLPIRRDVHSHRNVGDHLPYFQMP